MSGTENSLREALAAESQTNRKYLAFAARADQEGYPQVARLFRAAAEAETIHAHNYLRALKGVRSTKENIEEALGLEIKAYKISYPEKAERAGAEGDTEAEIFFRYALESEKIHAQLFQGALDRLESAVEDYPYFNCLGCGHTAEREPPGKCPVCGAGREMHERVD